MPNSTIMEENSSKILRSKSREHLSWQLILSAYLVEASLIIISFVTAISLTDTSDTSVFLSSSILLAILLSLVEPLKILAAQSVVIVSNFLGRFLALALLLFSTSISFENISQSLKMSQKNLTNEIDSSMNIVINHENKIEDLRTQMKDISKKSLPIFESQRSQLDKNSNTISSLQTQIEDIKKNNNKDQILSKQLNIKSLRESINASNERQDVLQANCFDRREEILKLQNTSASGRLFGRSGIKEMYNLEKNNLEQACSSQLEKINNLISDYNFKLSKLLQEKQELYSLSDTNIVKIDALEKKILELENTNNRINETAANQNQYLNNFQEKKVKDLEIIASKIKLKQASINLENKKIYDLKSNNILYALASTFFQIPTYQITSEQFESFLSIWLIVLGIGLCLIPPILAIIGEVIIVESDTESIFHTFFSFMKDKKAIRKELQADMTDHISKIDNESKEKDHKISNLEDLLSSRNSENCKLQERVNSLEQEISDSSNQNLSLTKENKNLQVEKEQLSTENECQRKVIQNLEKNKTYVPIPIDADNGLDKFLNKIYKFFSKNKEYSDLEEEREKENIQNNVKEIVKWKK